jgi:hypothetical protein
MHPIDAEAGAIVLLFKKKMMASMRLEVPFPLDARSLWWAKAWNAISVHSFYLSSFEMGNSLHLAPK